MKLIWTYDETIGKSFYNDEHRITYINYYILSITNAKKLGYKTVLYTTFTAKQYFLNIVDEIIEINKPYNTEIWDYLKIYVLENRNDKFCLIDGDLILHKKLPIIDEEIIFDSTEDWNWEYEYKETVEQFDKLNIKEIVNFWSTKKIPTMNLGILYINNNELKLEYIKLWKECNEWLKKQTQKINIDFATMAISQYLLTLICNNKNIKKKCFRSNTTIKSDFYNHYIGNTKFENKLVPSNEIIKIKNTLL